ncbi:NUDIX hydrolase [Nocardioides sp. GXZ039]|uniref:NUDIX hydrolase n=1 Tax=Nocardioides sp. GXZ039 TaxID=3136018 RepID=UPI0030F4B2A6
MPGSLPKLVFAAGAVVFRPGRQVLLVHRPKYDDWSFPKGKLDRGEHRTSAAVREVAEETGLHIRLGLPLTDQHYPVAAGHKTVHYWVGRVVGSDDVSGYRPNAEIDEVRWVPVEEAADLLTYEYDRATLAEAIERRRRTRPIVVLRHAKARARRTWRGKDRDRPLLRLGERQADRMVGALAAYAPDRVISSTSTRCLQTVEPYVAEAELVLESTPALSEEHASPDAVAELAGDVLSDDRPTLLCTHRPVLPGVMEELGVVPVALEPGEMLVLHVRKDQIVGVERHLVS